MTAADDAVTDWWWRYLVHVSACPDCTKSGPCDEGQELYEAWTAAKAAARQAAR